MFEADTVKKYFNLLTLKSVPWLENFTASFRYELQPGEGEVLGVSTLPLSQIFQII